MHPQCKFPAVLVLAALLPATAGAAWQVISAEPGKRVEIDRASIRKEANGKTIAEGRIILDKPIIDAKTSSSYRIVQALNRYDCALRTYSTLKRTYFKEEGQFLREDEVKVQVEMPVRSGMLDDKLLREVCRPKPGPEAAAAASRTADKVNEAAGELRKANEALLQKDVRRANLPTPATEKPEREAKAAGETAAPAQSAPPTPPTPTAQPTPAARPPAAAAQARAVHPARPAIRAPRVLAARPDDEPPPAAAPTYTRIPWAYSGEGGPDNWGRLKPEYATCANGRRQSPIDIRDGFRVDLETLQFTYRPSQFRVIDDGRTIQVQVSGNSIGLLGKTYELVEFHFHRPSEERVDGKSFDMVAHLVHKSADDKLAIVAVLLEKGMENPLIQTIWNNLPLERNEYVTPPGISIDLTQLLPTERGYYTYMGSLSTPPCTEGVLWLVLKQPQQISPEQLAIFARLYPHNARPIQASSGRMIKESR